MNAVKGRCTSIERRCGYSSSLNVSGKFSSTDDAEEMIPYKYSVMISSSLIKNLCRTWKEQIEGLNHASNRMPRSLVTCRLRRAFCKSD